MQTGRVLVGHVDHSQAGHGAGLTVWCHSVALCQWHAQSAMVLEYASP